MHSLLIPGVLARRRSINRWREQAVSFALNVTFVTQRHSTPILSQADLTCVCRALDNLSQGSIYQTPATINCHTTLYCQRYRYVPLDLPRRVLDRRGIAHKPQQVLLSDDSRKFARLRHFHAATRSRRPMQQPPPCMGSRGIDFRVLAPCRAWHTNPVTGVYNSPAISKAEHAPSDIAEKVTMHTQPSPEAQDTLSRRECVYPGMEKACIRTQPSLPDTRLDPPSLIFFFIFLAHVYTMCGLRHKLGSQKITEG